MAVLSPCFHTDESICEASPIVPLVVAVRKDRLVTIDIASGLEKSFAAQTQVKALKFSPDGKYLAVLNNKSSLEMYSGLELVYSLDLQVNVDIKQLLWSPNSKNLIFISYFGIYIGVVLPGEKKYKILRGISSSDRDQPLISFSPLGYYAAVVRNVNLVIYDSTNWSVVQESRVSVMTSRILWCSDTKLVTCGLWGSQLSEHVIRGLPPPTSSSPYDNVLCSSHRLLLVESGGGDLHSREVSLLNSMAPLSSAPIVQLKFHPSPRTVFSLPEYSKESNNFQIVSLMESRDKKEERGGEEQRSRMASFSPDGRWLACVGPSPCSLWLWSLLQLESPSVFLTPAPISCLNWHREYTLLSITAGSVVVFCGGAGPPVALVAPGPVVHSLWCSTDTPTALVSSRGLGTLVHLPPD